MSELYYYLKPQYYYIYGLIETENYKLGDIVIRGMQDKNKPLYNIYIRKKLHSINMIFCSSSYTLIYFELFNYTNKKYGTILKNGECQHMAKNMIGFDLYINRMRKPIDQTYLQNQIELRTGMFIMKEKL